MASIKEVEDWISKRIYPHVARTSDPLIVRVSRFSLLVNDTNFYAKIKNGLGYKGYLIYSSGLGTPILEESVTNETEFLNNDTFKKFISESGRNTNKLYEDTANMQVFLQDAAQSWLDTIELEIAKQPNDNAIKKAIDRLCWQLHYDITESHTNFPEVFKDNDFGDVQIDWDKNDTWNGKTVNESVFDNYTAISTSVTDGSSTISGGSSLQGVKSSISSFDGNLCAKFETFNANFTAFDTSLNGSTDSTRLDIKNSLDNIRTKLVPDGNYYSISECLREYSTSGEGAFTTYSIARSLREDTDGVTQTSVSQATHDQTTLESEEFSDIEGRIGITGNYSLADRIGDTDNVSLTSRIGVFNVDGYRSLFDTISGPNGYANTSKHSLSDAVGYLTGVGLEGKLNDIKSVIGDKNDVGVNETISGRVHTMYTSMQGENGVSGFVRYGTWNGETSWYVRAIT